MARVELCDPEASTDPAIRDIVAWVSAMEGRVPNHFRVEMNFPEFFKAKLGATKVLWEMGELSLEEIQHIGIAVSKANRCPYCTAAFCTILTHGLEADQAYAEAFVEHGMAAVGNARTARLVAMALELNADPRGTSDDDVAALRELGLTDKGIVQLVHLVSDFASYNRLNLALATDYDYRDIWRTLAFPEAPAE